MLELCSLSRSTFQSWRKAGLDIGEESGGYKSGAYGLNEAITLAILVSIREFLPTREMVLVWQRLVATGEAPKLTNAARNLKKGSRFDLVVEPRHAALTLAQTEEALVEAVRHPGDPRPVVVIDASERIYTVVRTFGLIGNRAPPPKKRTAGRPRSAERNVVRMKRRDR